MAEWPQRPEMLEKLPLDEAGREALIGLPVVAHRPILDLLRDYGAEIGLLTGEDAYAQRLVASLVVAAASRAVTSYDKWRKGEQAE